MSDKPKGMATKGEGLGLVRNAHVPCRLFERLGRLQPAGESDPTRLCSLEALGADASLRRRQPPPLPAPPFGQRCRSFNAHTGAAASLPFL